MKTTTLPRSPTLARILAAAGDGSTLKLDMFGVVGQDFTAAEIASKLDDDTKLVKVRLNSDGGFVNDGFAIYNLLRNHPARVEIEVVAAAMSAASYILMAADKSTIHSNGVVMIHEARGGVEGRAGDFETQATELRRINDAMIMALAARLDGTASEDEVRAMVAAETFIPAEQAVEMGLVDTLLEDKAPAKAMACLRPETVARLNVNSPQSAAQSAQGRKGDTMGTTAEIVQSLKSALEDLDDEEKKDLKSQLAAALGIGPKAAEDDDEDDEAAKAAKAAKAAEDDEDDDEEKAAKAVLAEIAVMLGASAKADPVGAIRALRSDATEFGAAVKVLTKDKAARDLDLVLSEAASRVTPAMAVSYRAQCAKGVLSLAGVKAVVETLPEIPGFAVPGRTRAQVSGADHPIGGKKWSEMSNMDKHNLAHADRDMYDALKAANA